MQLPDQIRSRTIMFYIRYWSVGNGINRRICSVLVRHSKSISASRTRARDAIHTKTASTLIRTVMSSSVYPTRTCRPTHQGTPGRYYRLWLNQPFRCFTPHALIQRVDQLTVHVVLSEAKGTDNMTTEPLPLSPLASGVDASAVECHLSKSAYSRPTCSPAQPNIGA